jgi:two-component system chemotaxis sensor kinase CheA
MSMDATTESLRAVFQQEADEALATMEQALLALEAQPDAADALNEVFRLAHTLKGGAAMVEYQTVADYAHKFEDALMMMREGLVPVTAARVTVMLQVVDALREMLSAQQRGELKRLRASDLALVGRLIPVELEQSVVAVDDTVGVTLDGTVGGTAAVSSSKQQSLRVNMSTLDGMLTLSGEIAVAKGRLQQSIESESVSEAALSAAEELGRLLATLHERVMEMRLVPIGPLFRQHQRTVRDVAASQGKLLRLVLEGEDVEVDAAIVEQLRDPLNHIVRNAVDHGLEFPAARRDAGKDPCGTVTLRARHERGAVIVEITDDGQGMSKSRILTKARERGLVAEGDVLTDNQVFALTMAPGLSTAAQVTELSGRGVGMDVVRRNVEALRGTIEIASAAAVGTTVSLRVPLTVAIIDGFVVGISDERYVIPVGSVTECLTASETEPNARSGVLSVRGEALPYIRLRHVLGVSKSDVPPRESIVIVQSEGRNVGLVVDELIGETQAVIKPLSGLFNEVRGVSGTTIMGDGRISLILDVGPLLDMCHA